MIQEISKDKWEELYNVHMKKDFPDNELYTLKQFLKNSNKKQVYSFVEDEIEKAYMITGETKQTVLIQYFAVYEEYRNKGVGTRFLQEYKQMIGNKKLILLEIENPEGAKTKKEHLKRIKRRQFYEKVGFIVEPRVKKYYFYEDYLLLTNKREHDINNTKEEIIKIYSSISPKYIMKKFYMEIQQN